MDDKDPPIEPQNFVHGPTVVDFGDLRAARGLSRRPVSSCKHQSLVYDTRERRIWCEDCETNVEAFDAFTMVIEQYGAAMKRLDRAKEEAEAATEHSLISLASKNMDAEWRKRRSLPCCPYCNHPMFPEDFKRPMGLPTASRDLSYAKRNKD